MTKKQLLDELKSKMEADTSLPLRGGATQLVFGDGDPDTEILFIGEGPGYWEDQKGVPFVGNAGLLLNQILLKIGVERRNIYITNVVHHRPPENRDPTAEEIMAYQTYLDEIIKIIDPKMIVTLGRFSMGKFMPNVFISSVHGREKAVDWKGKSITVVPMYHPAAALRSTEVKLKLTADFERLPEVLKKIKEKNDTIGEVAKKVEQMALV
ncbi:MAG: Phage SPO1 DNA polymerase-related protein [Candidatus Woesebacteria bacterium GW2011_GWC1_38_13]|uniref:Type-4 uracil-DNA glycosylase n=3 Tax=Candidatus Woeseibacteriota TaxID=1752722 RepID=A0A0G0KYT7_9BACT|nr:MAG: Phage SPO1 DNA polymerase-related protein [Candidatus Woesebacteria bacterium GW2011_GWC1_38_13]KKQ83902.1 MAG: Phage SPO1 DNA polymerase-related protein [Candidatus Woesebacteria bacterium GW2011_GWA1_38_8]